MAAWETFAMVRISSHMGSLDMILMRLCYIVTMMIFKSPILLDQRQKNTK